LFFQYKQIGGKCRVQEEERVTTNGLLGESSWGKKLNIRAEFGIIVQVINTRLDKTRSEVIRKELEISGIQDVKSKYKQNWINHLERMDNTRLPKHPQLQT
jgi:hypothetical protein